MSPSSSPVPSSSLRSRAFQTLEADAVLAVDHLHDEVAADGLSAIAFFCAAGYDLSVLGGRMDRRFAGVPVVGCTTAGPIGPLGYQRGGLSAVAFYGGDLEVTSHLVTSLDACDAEATRIGAAAHRRLTASGRSAFGLLLVDGLSLAEERLVSALYQSLGHVPIVGGSAGDDLAFERTHVYHEGRFLQNAAVFSLFETEAHFRVFKFQHVAGTDRVVVITGADPKRRVVHEINGKPAAIAYAELVGVAPACLGPSVFSAHPFIAELAGDQYVRSIQRVNPDGSLLLFCALDEGMVLSLGDNTDPLATAASAFGRSELGFAPQVVLGFDCILRRLQLEQSGQLGAVGDILRANHVVGFSTYGEQYNAVHVNQTFTGVAIGS
jgi:hypothetical protein